MELGAVRQVLVDIGHGLLQRRRILFRHAAAAAGLFEGVHHVPAGVQQILRLIQHALHRRLRVVRRQILRQQIPLLHDAADDHLQIILADGTLQRLHRRIGDLGSHSVLLGVLVVGDGRLARPVCQHPEHVPAELLVDDHRRVVVAGLHAALGLLLRIHDDPVDAGGLPQVVHHILPLVFIYAVLVGIALVQRGHRDGNTARIAVGIPVGVDIQPRVQAGQQRDGDHHHAGKEAPAQRPYIRFEHRPYISHTSSLCAEAAPLVKILSTQTEYQFTLYRIPEEFVHTKPHFCAKKRRETRLFSCFIPYYPPQCDSTHFPSAYTPARTAPRTPRSSPPWCRPADRGCPD